MDRVSLDLDLNKNRDSTIKKRINKLKGASKYQKETMTELTLLLKEAQSRLDECKIRGKIVTIKKRGILNLNFSFYADSECIFTGTVKNNDTFYLDVVNTIDTFRDIDVFRAYILNEAGEKKISLKE